MPRGIPRRAMVETGDLPPPPETPPEDFDPTDVQVVQPDRLEFKAKTEKFMNEKVVVFIEPGDKPNDPIFIELRHNGIPQVVMRGKEQAIKRKFLYAGLMARQVTISNTFGIGRDGKDFNKAAPSAVVPYRMSLISDPNPQGGARWFQSVVSQAHGLQAA